MLNKYFYSVFSTTRFDYSINTNDTKTNDTTGSASVVSADRMPLLNPVITSVVVLAIAMKIVCT